MRGLILAGHSVDPGSAGLLGRRGPRSKQPFMVTFFRASPGPARVTRAAKPPRRRQPKKTNDLPHPNKLPGIFGEIKDNLFVTCFASNPNFGPEMGSKELWDFRMGLFVVQGARGGYPGGDSGVLGILEYLDFSHHCSEIGKRAINFWLVGSCFSLCTSKEDGDGNEDEDGDGGGDEDGDEGGGGDGDGDEDGDEGPLL